MKLSAELAWYKSNLWGYLSISFVKYLTQPLGEPREHHLGEVQIKKLELLKKR